MVDVMSSITVVDQIFLDLGKVKGNLVYHQKMRENAVARLAVLTRETKLLFPLEHQNEDDTGIPRVVITRPGTIVVPKVKSPAVLKTKYPDLIDNGVVFVPPVNPRYYRVQATNGCKSLGWEEAVSDIGSSPRTFENARDIEGIIRYIFKWERRRMDLKSRDTELTNELKSLLSQGYTGSAEFGSFTTRLNSGAHRYTFDKIFELHPEIRTDRALIGEQKRQINASLRFYNWT